MSQEVRISKLVEVNVICECGASNEVLFVTRKECFAALKAQGWEIKLRRKHDPTVVCPNCGMAAREAKAERKSAFAAIRAEREAAIDKSRAAMKKLKTEGEAT